MARRVSLLSLLSIVSAQAINSQCDTFNSTFSLSTTQISQADLNSTTANNLNIAIEFEQSNWANGSVPEESFYTVPANSTDAPAGTLLKVQQDANTSAYTLPPNTALSRILFQSETFNGSTVPASAYVLWPWMPRLDPRTGRYAVVSWAHGTSGIFGDCAPSHIRNLWYQFSAPYILALQGYVVVAPDYAGLGVDHDAKGALIKHTYLANPAHANDLFYAVEAAQQAFPELSSNFVTMGHSQGGGAAWSGAQRQAVKPVSGYLGTVAGSPVTNTINQLGYLDSQTFDNQLAAEISYGLSTIFPDFNVSDFLTPAGIRRLDLLAEIGGCNSAVLELLEQPGSVFTQPDWLNTTAMQAYVKLTGNGGRPIAGPMLVVQGTADNAVPVQTTTDGVNATCSMYPQSQLEYAMFEGATHVPVLNAGQQVWLDWIADRFAGREPASPCSRTLYKPIRDVESYQSELEFFLELATQGYEVA